MAHKYDVQPEIESSWGRRSWGEIESAPTFSSVEDARQWIDRYVARIRSKGARPSLRWRITRNGQAFQVIEVA